MINRAHKKPAVVERAVRWLVAAAIAVALIPLHAPGVAQADDATVSLCTKAGFFAALHVVQTSGGGTIVFNCTGTIVVSGRITITSDVKIIGNGNVIFDGTDSTDLFRVNNGASLELIGLTLQNGNSGPGNGGAISNYGSVTITASTLSSNGATSGGAIYNFGDLTITASTLSSNDATYGGAIYNSGDLTSTASTLSGNDATNGGAIYNLDTLTITASTLSSNSATIGGAINDINGTLTIAASTLSSNSANIGGAISDINGTVTVRASIVAGNSASIGANCTGTITSQGSNLSNDTTCSFTATGDIQNSANVNLGALADNGGPTQTMLPQSGSGAIDAADCTLSSIQDQRGVTRPIPPSTCDIGAVETGSTVPVQIVSTYSSSFDEGSSATVGAVAYGPTGASLDYDFDCDNDGGYETQGSGTGANGTATCAFNEDGVFTVGVQVCDGGNCATDTTTVTVNNVAPTISAITNDGPIDEGSSATITVTASDPAGANDPLTYSFDCDNSGDYESAGFGNQGQCTFFDNGSFTVGVQVEDDDGGVATDSIDVEAFNVSPTVDTPIASPAPSSEGEVVTASATFSDPGILDTHTCTVDYGDGSGPEAGVVAGNTCTGPAHQYADDYQPGTSSDDYTVDVIVTDNAGDEGSRSVVHIVQNLAPTITAIQSNGPIEQGDPATVTVLAQDPAGVLDPLSYAFDCDDDGSYETLGDGNAGTCFLDPDESTPVVGVQVSDDDLGVVTGEVEIAQTVTLCFNTSTRAISNTNLSGSCGAGKMALVLSAATPTTLCIDIYDRSMRWAPRGTCTTGSFAHSVPSSGPLAYCASRWTGELRASYGAASCNAAEITAVVPG